MASSSKSKRIYDVFLSFRGTDVRNSFSSHLYRALNQNGIYAFRDSEELRKGDQISPALMEAIEESRIAIIIFSENYASSRWCLEELAKIMECKEQKNLTVLPVFYKVDPKEVRTGRKSYWKALNEHESKFGKDSEEVKRWKKALLDAGKLSGWHLEDGDESELIQGIVKEISPRLDRMTLHAAEHLVGIESQVVKLKSMLKLESNDDVVKVGLWGQGGIGKTTLARALYYATIKQFDGSCFLADVRERSQDCKGGLVTLQKELLKKILLLQQGLEVSDVYEGTLIIQSRLARKKVLLVLDDVDDLCQLDALVGEGNWFGNGSRIIVTTRNKHLLTCRRINHVYEVKALDYGQARELLSKHARQTHDIKKNLVDSALNYAKGLPLALEVLGSLLCGKTEDVWESTLKKLASNPDNKINNVLKVSYDGLHENDKEIFLHIACFFKGWEIGYTKKVLDSCNLQTVAGFDTLIERSLIRIVSKNLQMHDLIQSMGMDIVNTKSPDDPRSRSRLWRQEDVVEVMSSDMGNYNIKAIVLDLPKPTEMRINPNAFTKMSSLSLLILRNVRSSFRGPIWLPNKLRWFEWPECAGRTPEFSAPDKLVGLDMGKGYVQGVVKQFKDFHHLKYINFNNCESLVHIPDLSCTPNLEELVLRNCKNLKRFPDIPQKLERLKSLCLQGTAINELPTSIANLVSLEKMNLCNCKNLVSLPSSIYNLQSIKKLKLQDCKKLIRFPKYEDSADPSMKTGLSKLLYLNLKGCNLSEVEFLEDPSCFPLLRILKLSRNNITSLPTSINKRDHLLAMEVVNCYQLQDIPELPPFLEYLAAENCNSLAKTGDLISHFIHRGLTLARTLMPSQSEHAYCIDLPGGEIPEWFLPVEGDSISFQVSEDLCDKFLGVALCFVLPKDVQIGPGEIRPPYISLFVNGIRMEEWEARVWLDSDHIWLQVLTPDFILRAIDFGQSDGSGIQFDISIYSAIVKEWGLRIICKQLEDDSKVVIQDNLLVRPKKKRKKDMNSILLYEVGRNSIDSEAESSHMHEGNQIEIDAQEYWQYCRTSDEEQSEIGPEGNHELLSLEAWEPRPWGLLIRLAEMCMAAFARCFCC